MLLPTSRVPILLFSLMLSDTINSICVRRFSQGQVETIEQSPNAPQTRTTFCSNLSAQTAELLDFRNVSKRERRTKQNPGGCEKQGRKMLRLHLETSSFRISNSNSRRCDRFYVCHETAAATANQDVEEPWPVFSGFEVKFFFLLCKFSPVSYFPRAVRFIFALSLSIFFVFIET